MNILWHSTAPWSPSSYSVLTNRTVPSIVRAGHKVILSTWYGLEGQPLPWQIPDEAGNSIVDSVLVLPKVHGGDIYGGVTLRPTYEHFRANVLITCSDVWVFESAQTYSLNFAPWFPVDFDPIPKPILKAIEPAIYPMVYSKWGKQILEDAGYDKAHYVPCSASATMFTPGDKQKARESFKSKLEYDFMVTMVAANKDGSDRKGFSEALQGFAEFLKKRPNSMMYVHTNWGGPVNIGNIVQALGIADRVLQPDQYGYHLGMLDESYMVNVYRASDVLLNTCKSEGFGLPLVEAQLCGCPIAATDFSTTDELLFGGWKIDGQLDWGFGAESWRKRVFVSSVVDVLEEAYQNRNNDKLRQKARAGATRFDTKLVFKQYWQPALAEIERITSTSIFAVNGKAAKAEAVIA